jgi:hypothetical protein
VSSKVTQPAPVSLAKFAKQASTAHCFVCNLDPALRRELERLKGTEGVTYVVMGQWLHQVHGISTKKGEAPGKWMLEDHFQKEHPYLSDSDS